VEKGVLIIAAYNKAEGVGINGVGKLLSISKTTILKKLLK
jgi:hypothetical protein